MNKLLHDVMRLAEQLPERDQQLIAGAVIRTIEDLLGPSWAERLRPAAPTSRKDSEAALSELIQIVSRISRQGS